MFGEIHNPGGERLDYDWVPGDNGTACPVVIGHGVTANKERPWAVALSTALQSAGISSLRFSFSGNGDSGGRFGDSTVSKEVEDLGAVLDALACPVIYVGHSMGGAVGVLRAARDDRIRALVSLAGMVHVNEFARRKFGDVTPGKGYMWEKPKCPLSREFMDDMARIDSVVDLGSAIAVPWLLVHGDADTVVPLEDSHDIRAAAADRPGDLPELIELTDTDHVFSGAGEALMTEAVVPWVVAVLA